MEINIFYISVSILQRLLCYTSGQGINDEALLNKVGLDRSILDNTDNKIALEDYYAIIDEAIHLTQDPHFGLHMGENAELGDLSILGYIMANCRTLEESLKKVGKYFAIIGSMLDIYLEIEGDYSKLVYDMKKHYSNSCLRHCMDTGLLHFSNIIKRITRTPVEPKEVWIKFDPPENISEYQRLFKCPVLFSQPISGLVFSTIDLATPITNPNPELLALLEHHANSFLNKINEDHYLSRKISIMLFERIQGNNPTIDDVAKEMGMSVRVMQKKLKDEGATFSQVATDVRKELAKTYLVEKCYSVDDITYLLGFSEPSVFRRAFKSWTGLTPRQYRSSYPPLCKPRSNSGDISFSRY